MKMANVISLFQAGFDFLKTSQIMGVSLFMWLITGALFTMIGAFIRGRK